MDGLFVEPCDIISLQVVNESTGTKEAGAG